MTKRKNTGMTDATRRVIESAEPLTLRQGVYAAMAMSAAWWIDWYEPTGTAASLRTQRQLVRELNRSLEVVTG